MADTEMARGSKENAKYGVKGYKAEDAEANLDDVRVLSNAEYHKIVKENVVETEDGYFHRIEKYPATSCCCGFSCFGVLLIVMLVLAAGGVTIISFSTDVPMYLRDHRSYWAQTAVAEAMDVANAGLADDALADQERVDNEYSLEIIYIKDSGIMTTGSLERIKELEEKIAFHEDYPDYCTLDWNASTQCDADDPPVSYSDVGCHVHVSALQYMDPDFWVPTDPAREGSDPTTASTANRAIAQSSKLWMTGPDAFGFANPANQTQDFLDLTQSNIDAVVNYWGRYCYQAYQCPPDGLSDRSPFAFNLVNETADECFDVTQVTGESTAPNYFWQVSDSDFGLAYGSNATWNPTLRALRSEFYMGTPRRKDNGELYEEEGDDIAKQEEEIGEFLFNNFQDDLASGIGGGITVYWWGTGMFALYAEAKLAEAYLWVSASFLFVLFYLTVQTGSFVLAFLGMVMILLNFIPAIFIYRFIFQFTYFGVLNMLGVFIILGIGVDDIFVFLDTWNAINFEHPHEPFHEKMKHTLQHAGKAMATTSASTAFSFLANATSSFPAVYTFGIFCASLIICNFCSVTIVWPRVVAAWEYYIGESATWYTCYCFPCKSRSEWGYPEQEEGAEPTPGKVELFFRDYYYPYFIDGAYMNAALKKNMEDGRDVPGAMKSLASKLIIFFFSIYILVTIIYAAQLRPDPDVPNLFPDSDNYVNFGPTQADYFARQDNPFRINVQIPFGIKNLDQNDCDGRTCDPTDPEDLGTIEWDETIYTTYQDEYVQKWFLDFCADMESGTGSISASKRRVYQADSIITRPVRCFFQSFKAWCDENNCPRTRVGPALETDDYIVDADWYVVMVSAFLDDDQSPSEPDYQAGNTNQDVWADYIFAEDVFGTRVLRFIIIEAALTEEITYPFEDGIVLYENWEDWLESWTARSTQFVYNFQTNLDYAFVSDTGAFAYFYLQEAIIAEAFTGIALSLFLAFCVMSIATGNWLISLMATTTIATMVIGVIAFTVWNGWKLGVIEAVIYVMVVGMSVDYTVHLSDAYLESKKKTRRDRTRDMLFKMGVSVVSGAISTLGSSCFLLATYIIFFRKFGTFILFVISQSLVYSLVFFTALLNLMGPEFPEFGVGIAPKQWVYMSDDLLAYIKRVLSPDGKLIVDQVARSLEVFEDQRKVIVSVTTSKGRQLVMVPLDLIRIRTQDGDLDFFNDILRTCWRAWSRRSEEVTKWYRSKDTVVLADIHDILTDTNTVPGFEAERGPLLRAPSHTREDAKDTEV
uniref:SSD domain-containing protein n=2 Tax=Phaeomonas parva TaxID=124430 RepID=A0A7S1U3D8_9STRA|mmetsp:Transcript_29208/g.93546  ORF Transcript_29208/g.93546 Transcript_29208/m.93546 type:complete len:1266 (+) Transcript_29208:191-3988(+)